MYLVMEFAGAVRATQGEHSRMASVSSCHVKTTHSISALRTDTNFLSFPVRGSVGSGGAGRPCGVVGVSAACARIGGWLAVTGSGRLCCHCPPPTEGGHVLLVSRPRRGHSRLGGRAQHRTAFSLQRLSEACRGAKRKVQKGLRDARSRPRAQAQEDTASPAPGPLRSAPGVRPGVLALCPTPEPHIPSSGGQ